jgi:hypothetical protein
MDRPMIANVVLMMTGTYQSFEAPTPTQSSARAVVTITTTGRVRPVPTRGSRSVMLPRSGSPRPRTTSTMMITRNGSESGMPWRCVASTWSLTQWAVSDCATPMNRPPASAIG